MKLHLVGGFLGSGKTTAIINAAKALMAQGTRVGVITNDQGKYLVDTAFFRLADIPAVEVTGGCFCCNYDDLDDRLAQLIASTQPEVIFAESVGSCADIVATVVRPLLELGNGEVRPASFSVFADARLLHRQLLGLEMPFSDDVIYIFDKQIEEAGLVVINKADLLPTSVLEEVRSLLEERYSGKPALTQTSLTPEGVQPWLEQIQAGGLALPETVLEMDYGRYGAGEAQLAWLDEVVELHFPAGAGRRTLQEVIERFTALLAQHKAGIGHLKFILQAGERSAKLSFPTLEEPGWQETIPELPDDSASLLVNARVELPAADLADLLHQALDAQPDIDYSIHDAQAFHPGHPKPTHRIR